MSAETVIRTVTLRLRAAGCVFAEDEARLLVEDAQNEAELETYVRQRVLGRPLEYILGWAEFCGLRIPVDEGVFVPRRRTELMVREALDRAVPSTVLLDLCCGSGAIGVAVAAGLDDVEWHAADVDQAAVANARRVVEPAGGRVYHGDLFDPLPGSLKGRVDLLVANVPYVPSERISAMPPEAREHEPPIALDGGGDGLDVFRRVAELAPDWLAPGGHLLVEIGEEQAQEAQRTLARHGLSPTIKHSAELWSTLAIGTKADSTRRRRIDPLNLSDSH